MDRARSRTAGREPAVGEAGTSPASARERSLRVTAALSIPWSELTWRYSTSGGPGGQHANRTATRVEVSFDVASSSSLGPRQRRRLLERIGPVVTATASDERSQHRNREIALDRLGERLREALRTPRARVATTPSAASQMRRVEEKRMRSTLKRERAKRYDRDD